MDTQKLELISKIIRYYIIAASTKAGSGHPTSSLSAADLMAVLYFNFLKYDFKNPNNRYNDRLIFSKGHASPLLYALYKVAGVISEEELMTYRTLYSPLQGHPTPETPYVDVATGSLGMGLSFGLGMAIANKSDGLLNKHYVLLGDGEMAEGNIWEAIEIAAHYKTNNLVGILDVNRLAETGETLFGHDVYAYEKRIAAFGWGTIVIDGHNIQEIISAFEVAQKQEVPFMIIAKTIKGKGVSFLEDKLNKHGKALKDDEAEKAYQELNVSSSEKELIFPVGIPEDNSLIIKDSTDYNALSMLESISTMTQQNEPVPTRKAYGIALSQLIKNSENLYVLDGDLSDSTFSGLTAEVKPNQFFNMFIAEQNMIAVGTGMTKMGKTVFASSFAAFLTRAYDQIRVSSLSESNLKITGSHVGVSIGEDGASQMGLEDIAMMRAIFNSTILYPSDAISTAKLLQQIPSLPHITYLRTTRKPTPVIYHPEDEFPIGKSKTIRSSDTDQCLIIAAGVTLHEALAAYEDLKSEGINVRILDCYSVKPIDTEGIISAARDSNNTVITVEDHYFEGGIGDAVLNVFSNGSAHITKMAITERPHSGKPAELLERYGISAKHIVEKVKEVVKIQAK
ncbi:MAG: transketolase [bacterium]|nr:transketolase [bacterium]